MASIIEKLDDFKAKLNLPCPGSFESLHREVKGVFPTLHMFDGAKVDLTSVLSPAFHLTHSFSWGSQMYPPMYNLGCGYAGKKIFLQGQVDSDGNLSARTNYTWYSTIPAPPSPNTPIDPNNPPTPPPPPGSRPSSTSKVQIQTGPGGGPSVVQLEHDHIGTDYSINVKAVNPNPIDNAPVYAGQTPSSSRRKVDTAMTGVYIFQYLQSVSPAWALGAEYVYQRQTPEIEEPAMTFVARWAPRTSTPLPAVPALPAGMPSPYMPVNPHDPQQVLTATWQPSSGLIHTSFFRRINQRLELGTEVQMLATKSDFRQEGRREGVASVGFKLDTVFATIRGMVDTQGKVSSVIEEKLAQGLSFQICGELDYSKGNGGQGRVGVGFSLEA